MKELSFLDKLDYFSAIKLLNFKHEKAGAETPALSKGLPKACTLRNPK